MASVFREATSILSRSILQLQEKLAISRPTTKDSVKSEKKNKRDRRSLRRRSNSPSGSESPTAPVCNKDIAFYFENYKCPENTRNVMVKHGVVDKLLEAHIKRLQDKAWSIFPYPCIGLFEFVKFNLPTYPSYPHLLSLLQAGGTYLDVGCCVGQDLRYLLSYEKIPASQLFGSDLQPEFLDIGYELFMDTPTSIGHMRLEAADIFDADSWLVREMTSRCAAVHAGYFLHLFGRARQLQAAIRLVGFLDKTPGNVIVGRIIGSKVAGEYTHPVVGVMMRHNAESFEKFWEEVGRETGCQFKLQYAVNESTVRISADGKRFDHPAEEMATDITFCIMLA